MPEALHSPETYPAWFLVGPTAVGKTAVAQRLAEQSGAAILSADAMLVYRGMDIGTAKPTLAEQGSVPYFGLNLVEPDQPFSAGAWLDGVRAQIAASGRLPGADRAAGGTLRAGDLIVAGGTGLYLRALVAGLDAAAADPDMRQALRLRLAHEGLEALRSELFRRAPEARASLADPDNPRRVIRALEHIETRGALPSGWLDAPRPRAVGLRLPRPDLHARIAARVERMFAAGLIDEVAALRVRFPAWAAGQQPSAPEDGGRMPVCTAWQAIGYAEASALLDGRLTLAQAKEQVAARTRQLAKRQETWLRHQAEVTWLEVTLDEPVDTLAARVLAAWREHGPTDMRWS